MRHTSGTDLRRCRLRDKEYVAAVTYQPGDTPETYLARLRAQSARVAAVAAELRMSRTEPQS